MNIVERYLTAITIEGIWQRITSCAYSRTRELSSMFTMGSPAIEDMVIPGRAHIDGTVRFALNGYYSDINKITAMIEEHGIKFSSGAFLEGVRITCTESPLYYYEDDRPSITEVSMAFVAKSLRTS